MTQKKKLTRAEEKLLISKMVQVCQDRANELMKKWKPLNKSWPTKKGGAYIRLSTEHQVLVEGGSLEQQINQAFDEMIARSKEDQINYQIVMVFIDAAISGQTDDRADFRRLQLHVKKGKLDFVIIKDVARLFRHAFLFSQFFEGCISVGCEVMFKGLPVNPNDPNDVLKLRMLAAIAEFEARNTSKRVRENVYSAMVHNGKFNSTQKVLGLDQLIADGTPLVGQYQPNREELKIVEWIMETFIRVASYQVTLDEINKRGIKNKNGHEFKKNSLTTLLTNMKYIGKWELNAENKDKPTKKLMPYEQHRIVDCPS